MNIALCFFCVFLLLRFDISTPSTNVSPEDEDTKKTLDSLKQQLDKLVKDNESLRMKIPLIQSPFSIPVEQGKNNETVHKDTVSITNTTHFNSTIGDSFRFLGKSLGGAKNADKERNEQMGKAEEKQKTFEEKKKSAANDASKWDDATAAAADNLKAWNEAVEKAKAAVEAWGELSDSSEAKKEGLQSAETKLEELKLKADEAEKQQKDANTKLPPTPPPPPPPLPESELVQLVKAKKANRERRVKVAEEKVKNAKKALVDAEKDLKAKREGEATTEELAAAEQKVKETKEKEENAEEEERQAEEEAQSEQTDNGATETAQEGSAPAVKNQDYSPTDAETSADFAGTFGTGSSTDASTAASSGSAGSGFPPLAPQPTVISNAGVGVGSPTQNKCMYVDGASIPQINPFLCIATPECMWNDEFKYCDSIIAEDARKVKKEMIPSGQPLIVPPNFAYIVASGNQECQICQSIISKAYLLGTSNVTPDSVMGGSITSKIISAQIRELQACPAFTEDRCNQDLGGVFQVRSPCPSHLKCHYCLGINPLHCLQEYDSF